MTVETITVNPYPDDPLNMLDEPSATEESSSEETKAPVDGVANDDTFLKRFSELNERETQLKTSQSQLDENKKSLQSKLDLLDELKKSPYKTLEKLGVNIDDFFHDYMGIVNEQPADDVSLVKKELSELKENLKKQQEEKEKHEAEKKQQDEQKQWTQYIGQIKDYVSQKDNYELLHANEAYEDVLNLIKDSYLTSGKQMSLDEACVAIEAKFEEKANKLLALKKIKSKFEKPAAEATKRPHTITSKLVGSTAKEVYGKREMNEDERFAEAVRIFKEENK